MKFKFDPNLEYQKKAINSIVDVFEGQTSGNIDFEISYRKENSLMNELASGNKLTLSDEDLLDNVNKIQLRNGLAKSKELKGRNFTIEMETGTGKTYVYLRTILELNKNYGFKKFIIVVPSVAIKEGVYKSLEMTEEHFKNLSNNISYDYFIYDSDRLNEIRSFSQSNTIKIMIINIQAFNKKKNNIIHKEQDRMNGREPIEYIKNTNPITIIDEPQNMETKKSRNAINSLNPLCTLRYSATHKKLYNLMYRLGPVDAYNKGLVKKIEVYSIVEDEDYNYPYIKLIKVDNKNGIRAKIEIDIKKPKNIKRKKVWVKSGTDLYKKTNEREIYRGWLINNIEIQMDVGNIEFTNGHYLEEGQAIEKDREAIQRAQIRSTIIEHLNKERILKNKGIKVLSLFFIDKVSNYREYTENGPQKGKFAKWFEEEYKELIKRNKYKKLDHLHDFKVDKLHNGYFSKDNKGNWRDTPDTKRSRNAKHADRAYQLIMKDKEKLLDNTEPLRFIFSHSALREGWDNPNVFQICTLNETKSKMKKRQEIGRGLRLAVTDDGIRTKNQNINVLTVMANESYEDYVDKLQSEMEKEAGEKFGIIKKHYFANIEVKEDGKYVVLGHEKSEEIFNNLREKEYINKKGKVKEKFFYDVNEDNFKLNDEFSDIKNEVAETIKSYTSVKQRVKNARKKEKVKLNEKVYMSKDFKRLWDKIKHKTTYRVEYDTKELIERAVKEIKNMPEIKKPKLKARKAEVDIKHSGLDTKEKKEQYIEKKVTYNLPDILTYLQNETKLTCKTIVDILIKSNRLDEFKNNPQKFMDEVYKRITRVLNSLIIEGIKYEKIDNEYYEMQLFENKELEKHLDRLIKTQKTVYNYTEYDSDNEKKFAEKLDDRDDIVLFTKLPSEFKIDTPIGTYNPDWAIVKEDEMNNKKLYLVRETKGSKTKEQLREIEENKIKCGKEHFKALGTDYKVVTKAEEI